jgi:Kef-type K+ transport system membrane component KefB
LINQNVFIVASALLILGFLFSWFINKVRMPRVTGYIIAGVILGPSFVNFFKEGTLSQLDFLPQLALGIIALVIGAGLSFDLIKRLKFRLIIITLLQALGAFFLVLILLLLFRMPLGAALPLAAIATATAPAATLAVIKEYRAHGPLTETALAVIALDDAVAIILFGLILTFDVRHLEAFGPAALQSLTMSGIEILLALAFGVALGWITHFLIKITRETTDTLIIILGIVLLGIGLASISHVSALLTNMFLGLTLINISSKNSDIITNLEKLTPPIYCIFFVLAGAHLNLKIFGSVGYAIIAWSSIFILARILGKVSGSYLGGVLSQASLAIRKYLGLILVPQAGIAIGLTLLITAGSSYFEFKSIILNVTLIAVAFNEIVGPLLTKFALYQAREVEEIRKKEHMLPLEYKA